MFSRIKGALDRSLAEEQARHKASTERGANSNPASTTNNNNGLPLRQADPAVFEDAFKLDEDDTDAINRSATPKPAPPENGPKVNSDDTNPGKSISPQKLGQNSENEKAAEIDADAPEKTGEPALPPSVPPASTNLPPKIVTRLKRLDKLEGTYKGE
ncbi:hypothetical protein GGS21DRAFT_255135 [Xylaria nigripes]|nr:hypothetical protein GGS21DRAFT_255135 [Xylaria nigripes]